MILNEPVLACPALPESETLFGEEAELLVTITAPLNVPALFGVKTTAKWVVSPGCKVRGTGGIEAKENGPGLMVSPLIDRLAVPEFCMATV